VIFLNDIIPIHVNWRKNVNDVQIYTYIYIYEPGRELYDSRAYQVDNIIYSYNFICVYSIIILTALEAQVYRHARQTTTDVCVGLTKTSVCAL